MRTTTFGVLVTTRGFFNPVLAQEGRRELLAKLDELGYEYVVLPEDATPTGAVQSVEDAVKCARLFRDRSEDIDGIIVCVPNFGDEGAVVTALDKADLRVPVLIHACDDDLDQLMLERRRDSFCGKLSICNNLRQYGIAFTNTTYHTCAIDSEAFSEDIRRFDKVCRVVRGLTSARIGQIGTRPAAFQTVRYSEKLLQEVGITVVPVDLSVIIAAAHKMAGAKEVDGRIAEIKAYGRLTDEATDDALRRSAQLSLAIERWMTDNGCVAGAVQCWDSIQANYGCATCLPMSMLSEKGVPMACEVDIMGAVSMYALYLASGEPAAYLDWNNNYGDERDTCICTHCSAYPKSFFAAEFELSPLDILGASLGRENCFAGCKGYVAPGPMTFAKVSTDDSNGVIRAYVGEGQFTDDPVSTPGGVAVCKIERLQEFLDFLCRQGFEHHVAMSRSMSAGVLEEAFETYLGFDVYRHR